MSLLRRLGAIPASYRVPLMVALLMVVISAMISERVLARLSRTQEIISDWNRWHLSRRPFLSGIAGGATRRRLGGIRRPRSFGLVL